MTDTLPATQNFADVKVLARGKHDAHTIRQGLVTLAYTGGSTTRASEMLKAAGINLDPSILGYWKRNSNADAYNQIVARLGPQLDELALSQLRQTVVAAGELERDMLEDLHGSYRDMEPKDKAGAIRNIATAKGIALDKMLTLTGRPTQITEHRSADEIMRQLERLGVLKPDEPAVDAEIIEEEAA